MTVAAVTITYDRLDLTKKTVNSFYLNTSVDYHLFIDNGSKDGTVKYLEQFNHVLLEKNFGIAYAFREAVQLLSDYDFILKLDNDIETVTEDIINKMLYFYKQNDMNYVCSPVDLNLDKKYAPAVFSKGNMNGFNYSFVTHTGGAFQLIPYDICRKLVTEYTHLRHGDYMIGKYYRNHRYKPTYLTDLEMRHIGINQSSKDYVL
jgi:GT2 family glycosyltransferase